MQSLPYASILAMVMMLDVTMCFTYHSKSHPSASRSLFDSFLFPWNTARNTEPDKEGNHIFNQFEKTINKYSHIPKNQTTGEHELAQQHSENEELNGSYNKEEDLTDKKETAGSRDVMGMGGGPMGMGGGPVGMGGGLMGMGGGPVGMGGGPMGMGGGPLGVVSGATYRPPHFIVKWGSNEPPQLVDIGSGNPDSVGWLTGQLQAMMASGAMGMGGGPMGMGGGPMGMSGGPVGMGGGPMGMGGGPMGMGGGPMGMGGGPMGMGGGPMGMGGNPMGMGGGPMGMGGGPMGMGGGPMGMGGGPMGMGGNPMGMGGGPMGMGGGPMGMNPIGMGGNPMGMGGDPMGMGGNPIGMGGNPMGMGGNPMGMGGELMPTMRGSLKGKDDSTGEADETGLDDTTGSADETGLGDSTASGDSTGLGDLTGLGGPTGMGDPTGLGGPTGAGLAAFNAKRNSLFNSKDHSLQGMRATNYAIHNPSISHTDGAPKYHNLRPHARRHYISASRTLQTSPKKQGEIVPAFIKKVSPTAGTPHASFRRLFLANVTVRPSTDSHKS